MSAKYRKKPAEQDEITLYCLMGKALCMAQIVEDALCRAITLKMGPSLSRKEANEILEKRLSDPLGRVTMLAKKESIFPESLQQALETFKEERNWLVHKCVQVKGFVHFKSDKTEVFRRIQAITENAHTLQQSIEEDMMEFCEANGKDMSEVRAVIKQYEES